MHFLFPSTLFFFKQEVMEITVKQPKYKAQQ